MFGGDSIDDFVTVFTDPTHPLCGKIGRIVECDYSESTVTVLVVDLGKHTVPYGRDENGMWNSPLHAFGRNRDNKHRKEEPNEFMAAYLECNRGNIADLQTQYQILFGEKFETLLEYKRRIDEKEKQQAVSGRQ